MLTTLIFLFFFNDTATTEIYTLSLHDALPILKNSAHDKKFAEFGGKYSGSDAFVPTAETALFILAGNDLHRSEEHTSELQSHLNLVCRLLLEKKKTQPNIQLDHQQRL